MPPAKGPTRVPGQLVQRRGVVLLEFFKRGRRFVQHAAQFRDLLLRRGNLLLKLHRLLVGGYQELVALRHVVWQRVGSIHVTHDYNNLFRSRNTKLVNKDGKQEVFQPTRRYRLRRCPVRRSSPPSNLTSCE
jgi:hypothetical protein